MFRRTLLPVATVAAAVLVLLSVGCSAQDSTECGYKNVVNGFNATLYMGKWYEYAKKGAMPYEDGGACVTAEYSMADNNITVINSMKDNSSADTSRSTNGWAEFAGDHTEAKLKVHFPNSSEAGIYWVLSTDYDNYSIVWSCMKHQGSAPAKEISWILLRSRNQSNMTLDKVEDELKNHGLSPLSTYKRTEQSDQYCAGAEHVVGAVLSVVMASLFALLH